MNKAELIESISQKTTLSRKDVEAILDTFEEITLTTLKAGGEVTLTGFGTFMTKRREARMGVNPQQPTEKIQIPAVTVPKFKAGKNLKEALK
ncbi:MAG: HU family DNA-binding protein [Patescibacteria group bacterium]